MPGFATWLLGYPPCLFIKTLDLVVIYQCSCYFCPSDSEVLLIEIDKYKAKCLKDLTKQMTSVLIYSIKNTLLRRYCKKDKARMADFADAGSCLNRNDVIISRCYKNFIDQILGAKNAPDTFKIPHMCWFVLKKKFDFCFYQAIFELQ